MHRDFKSNVDAFSSYYLFQFSSSFCSEIILKFSIHIIHLPFILVLVILSVKFLY